MDMGYFDFHDVTMEDPFVLKDSLEAIALMVGSKNNVINLGRGDPMDPPSIRASGVVSFFLVFSFCLQNKIGQLNNNLRFLSSQERQLISVAWNETEELFSSMGDGTLISDARETRDLLETNYKKFHPFSNFHLGLVARSMMGADYEVPEGNEIMRSLMAEELRCSLPSMRDLTNEKIIITNGASDAIATIFKFFKEIGYLKNGDQVGCISPVYSPYNTLADKMGLQVVSLQCDPNNAFEPTERSFREFTMAANKMKVFSLVNPNNPTGRVFSPDTLSRIGRIIKDNKAVAIEDAVYRKLITNGDYTSLHRYIPETTIFVDSMSKFYRATGTRIGCIAINDRLNTALSKRFGESMTIYGESEFYRGIIRAKAPATKGVFAHTQMAALPAQWVSIFRILWGQNDGKIFAQELETRWRKVYENLGVKPPDERSICNKLGGGFVPYYCLIDLAEILPSQVIHNSDPWDFLKSLAENQVVVLPAAGFFTNANKHKWTIRISVANQTATTIEEAMKRLNSVIAEFQRSNASASH